MGVIIAELEQENGRKIGASVFLVPPQRGDTFVRDGNKYIVTGRQHTILTNDEPGLNLIVRKTSTQHRI